MGGGGADQWKQNQWAEENDLDLANESLKDVPDIENQFPPKSAGAPPAKGSLGKGGESWRGWATAFGKGDNG